MPTSVNDFFSFNGFFAKRKFHYEKLIFFKTTFIYRLELFYYFSTK